MPSSEPKFDRQHTVLAILALALLSSAGGLLVTWLRHAPGSDKSASKAQAAPLFTKPYVVQPAPSRAPETGLYQAGSASQAEEVSFGQLMDLLNSSVDKPEVTPVAKKFAAAFKAQPALKSTLERFEARRRAPE